MKKIEHTMDVKADVKTVFQAVTNNKEYGWRKDIDNITIISDRQFIEYNKKGIKTKMTITTFIENVQYEFDMDSKNYLGHWCGQFASLPDGGCRLYITEYLEVKSRLLKPLSIFMNARKFQNQYLEDLKEYVESI